MKVIDRKSLKASSQGGLGSGGADSGTWNSRKGSDTRRSTFGRGGSKSFQVSKTKVKKKK